MKLLEANFAVLMLVSTCPRTSAPVVSAGTPTPHTSDELRDQRRGVVEKDSSTEVGTTQETTTQDLSREPENHHNLTVTTNSFLTARNHCPEFKRYDDNGRGERVRLVTPGASVALTLSICSIIANILNISVHWRKHTVLATYLIALSFTDILLACVTVVVQSRTYVRSSNESEASVIIFTIIRGSVRSFLRVSHVLGTLISIDRFIHLSSTIPTMTCIQRRSKSVVAIVIALMFLSGSCEIYASYTRRRSSQAAARATTCDGTGIGTDFNSSTVSSAKVAFEFENVTAMPVGRAFGNMSEVKSRIRRKKSGSRSGVRRPSSRPVEDARIGTTSSRPIPEEKAVDFRKVFFQNVSLANDTFVLAILALMIVLNTATLIFLKRRSQERKQLGVGGMGDRPSVILVTMTTVYVILTLPSTTLFITRGMRSWPIVEFTKTNDYFTLVFAKICVMTDQLRNMSDFVVFLFMSRMFRSSLLTSIAIKRRTASLT